MSPSSTTVLRKCPADEDIVRQLVIEKGFGDELTTSCLHEVRQIISERGGDAHECRTTLANFFTDPYASLAISGIDITNKFVRTHIADFLKWAAGHGWTIWDANKYKNTTGYCQGDGANLRFAGPTIQRDPEPVPRVEKKILISPYDHALNRCFDSMVFCKNSDTSDYLFTPEEIALAKFKSKECSLLNAAIRNAVVELPVGCRQGVERTVALWDYYLTIRQKYPADLEALFVTSSKKPLIPTAVSDALTTLETLCISSIVEVMRAHILPSIIVCNLLRKDFDRENGTLSLWSSPTEMLSVPLGSSSKNLEIFLSAIESGEPRLDEPLYRRSNSQLWPTNHSIKLRPREIFLLTVDASADQSFVDLPLVQSPPQAQIIAAER